MSWPNFKALFCQSFGENEINIKITPVREGSLQADTAPQDRPNMKQGCHPLKL